MQRLNYTRALSRTNEPETLLWDRALFYYGFYDETNLATAISRARRATRIFSRGEVLKKKNLINVTPALNAASRRYACHRNRIARN